MSRVQKAPGVWVDEEPREAHLSHGGMLVGSVIPDMRPIISMGGLKDMARPTVPRCGAWLVQVGTSCALRRGHLGNHRSQTAGERERHAAGEREGHRLVLDLTIPARADARKRRHEDSPRCGFLMKHAKEPCAKLPKHRDCHRTQAAIDAEAGRKRDKYPRRMAA